MRPVGHEAGSVAHRPPRLLFLGHTLPAPPDTGARERTYQLLRHLSAAYEVHALFFDADVGRPSVARQRLAALPKVASAQVFAIRGTHSRLARVVPHGRSVVQRRPYTEFLYRSVEFREALSALLREFVFAMVHVDGLDLGHFLPFVAHLPVVCAHHNIESELLRRRADLDRGWFRGRYLRWQSTRLARLEDEWWPRVSLNLVVSDRERALLAERSPRARVAVVPNGVDVDFFQETQTEHGGMAFIGGTDWEPNRDALHYFCDRILPRIRARHPDLPARWVGRATPSEQRAFAANYGVVLTGYVPDIRPPLADAACVVVPLRAGSGTRLKILCAWAMGKPVVTTSIGCEGLAARDGENALVRDDPDAFADAVSELLDDPQLRRRLGRAGRTTAVQRYDWSRIGADALGAYEGVLTKRAAASPPSVPARRA